MKIEFTEEQFRNLVMMSDLANWVLGLLGDHMQDKKYKRLSDKTEEIENYLLDFAGSFESGDLVEKCEEGIILKDKVRKKFQEIMDDYEEFILFDSLTTKLAWRDFRKIYSEEEMDKMAEKNGGYFGVELYDFEKRYWDEFEKHDYNRLEIKT